MTHQLLHPQPLGIFPLPAAYLVVPPVTGAEEVCAVLLDGYVPERVPIALRFYTLALANEKHAAWLALTEDSSLEARYNRFVLQSKPAQYSCLRHELDGELAALLDLVAYTAGIIDAPPAADRLHGEVAGCVLPAHAAYALAHHHPDRAIAALCRAVEEVSPISPLFAAQLLAHLAETYVQYEQMPAALQALRDALAFTSGRGLPDLRAYFALRLGALCQDHANGQETLLHEASVWYEEALRYYTRDHAPEPFAAAHHHLALAYLAMASHENSARLFVERAVWSLHQALTVYAAETHYEYWHSVQSSLTQAQQMLLALSNGHTSSLENGREDLASHGQPSHASCIDTMAVSIL